MLLLYNYALFKQTKFIINCIAAKKSLFSFFFYYGIFVIFTRYNNIIMLNIRK